MTNAQIIFEESQRLAQEGIINYTGRTFKYQDDAGNTFEVKEVEPIHTFAGWKSMGYKVKKGEHAVAKFTIWKCRSKKELVKGKDAETGEIVETEETHNKMFMKEAHFFKASQVEKIAQ